MGGGRKRQVRMIRGGGGLPHPWIERERGI